MKISARNVLRGKVKSIKKDGIHAEVVIAVARGIDIVSVCTAGAIDELKLKKGQEALAMFTASSTMVGIPHRKRGE